MSTSTCTCLPEAILSRIQLSKTHETSFMACLGNVQMIRILPRILSSSLTSGEPALGTFLTNAASTGLLKPCITQQPSRGEPPQLKSFSTLPHHCLSTCASRSFGHLNTAGPRGLQQPWVLRRRICSMYSHAQAALATEQCVPSRVEDKGTDAEDHDSRSRDGDRASLWQKVRYAGSSGAKRKVAASGSMQQQPTKKGKGANGSSTSQQHRQVALHRQAQLGRKGVTDLGQGAQVVYLPGMFDRTEAAALLAALQVIAFLLWPMAWMSLLCKSCTLYHLSSGKPLFATLHE